MTDNVTEANEQQIAESRETCEHADQGTKCKNGDIKCETGELVNSVGKKLYCRYWKPCNEPKALVFLCHGYAEHLQVYGELGQRIAATGSMAFGHDHVGHGLSEGVRVHVETMDDYVTDVFQHTDLLKEQYPNLPMLILGHSMGGMITLKAAMKRPEYFRGMVLCGPLVLADPDLATPFKQFLAKVFSRLLPSITIIKLDINSVTRDQEMVEMMKNDPLRWQGGFKFKWAYECMLTLQEISNNLTTVTTPFLIIHGEKDKLCDPHGSKLLHDLAATKDKKLKMYPEAAHNLYLELPEVREEAFTDTVSWLAGHTQVEDTETTK